MRVLVVGDIHANWHALNAIREPFDACLCTGDIVDYGTDPVPCVEWVREHAETSVRGNHDHAVAQHIQPLGGSGFRRLSAATRPLHWELLSGHHLQFLAQLPITTYVTLDSLTFYLVHATPHDPMDEYLIDEPDVWRERLAGVEADIVCVGHSHIPFHLDLGDVQVVNPGSVGQPRDGDSRCAYAIIEDGRVELKRAAYDIDATLEQMRSTGVDEAVLRTAETVLKSGRGPGLAPR